MSTHRPPLLRFSLLLGALMTPLGACGGSDRVAEARDLQAAQRFEDSLEPLRAVLEERPDDAEVQYLYGHALVGTGQPSLAQFALRQAMEDPEWLVPAGLEFAAAALLTNNPEEAIAATDRILQAEPDHMMALLVRSRGKVMTRVGYEDSLADAVRALELDPGNIEGLMLRSVSLLGLEKIEEAEAALRELDSAARDADLDPSEAARYCGMRAVFAKEKRDLESAERIFDECLQPFPAEPVLIQQAIEYFDARGLPERSLEILRNALAALPSAGSYRRLLAARLVQAGEVAEAERILREGTEIANPWLSVEAWVDLGNHYHAREDYAAAATALGKALEISGSEDTRLVFDHADALVMAQRYDEALEVARGMSVPAHRALVEGRVELERGRPALALERFSEALRVWPDNAVARYYAALAAEGTGDFDRAVSEYRYSIRADANATDARLRLARLHLAEGAVSRALAALRHDASRAAGLELQLLDLHVSARLARMGDVQASLAELAKSPGVLGRGVAAAAEGARERQGPEAAARLVQGVNGLDLTDPANSDALRALVADLAATGRSDEALAAARAAIAKHPDVAAFQAIHAAALASSGAPAEASRAAYSRALELDPASAAAMLGLAKLASAAGDASAALELYARAAAADQADATALRACAELLVSLGRAAEAEEQLAQALQRSPYDGRAAARLAELLLDRDGDLDRALALAERAVRFGGGSAGAALVSRAQARRGGPELAERRAAEPTPAAEPEVRSGP